jgi:hypothetical protein
MNKMRLSFGIIILLFLNLVGYTDEISNDNIDYQYAGPNRDIRQAKGRRGNLPHRLAPTPVVGAIYTRTCR